jgi:hypothetical protein
MSLLVLTSSDLSLNHAPQVPSHEFCVEVRRIQNGASFQSRIRHHRILNTQRFRDETLDAFRQRSQRKMFDSNKNSDCIQGPICLFI